VLREMETMTDDLVSKKLAVKSRLLDARDRLLEAERSMELARNRQIEIKRDLSAIEAEKAAFETGWRQRLLEEMLAVSRERDAVGDQLQKANRRQSMVVLVAPVDAVVLDIAKLSQGSIVREAETFFTLVPIGEVLEADVQIDSQDIGYIKIGTVAHVKIDAFPFQKHGMLDGKLRTVSQDAFRRDANSTGVDAFYGGRVAFENLQLDNMPEHAKLLPGMTLSAEILVGKRSVMSYLLWPLTKAAKESIREP
jgi:HlyD family secretion protein